MIVNSLYCSSILSAGWLVSCRTQFTFLLAESLLASEAEDRLREIYVYIGITSLCLYSTTGEQENQYGKLYKMHYGTSCKTQKTVTMLKNALTRGCRIWYNEPVGCCLEVRRFLVGERRFLLVYCTIFAPGKRLEGGRRYPKCKIVKYLLFSLDFLNCKATMLLYIYIKNRSVL